MRKCKRCSQSRHMSRVIRGVPCWRYWVCYQCASKDTFLGSDDGDLNYHVDEDVNDEELAERRKEELEAGTLELE